MNTVRPKKSLGQHFLRDGNIAQKIVDSLSISAGEVLEIGPGMGILTKLLLEKPDINVHVVEFDTESVEYLQRHFSELKDKIYHQDFLKWNAPEVLPHFAVIGNFPYNISSQIFFRILEWRHNVSETVCMIQKEVAERIISPPGSKVYGILSVLLGAFFHTEYLFTVSEHVFNPPPKVKSAVIRLRRNERSSLDCNEALFFKVVKAGFNKRRKMLRNSLNELGMKVPEKYADKRPEHLSVAEFIELTRLLET